MSPFVIAVAALAIPGFARAEISTDSVPAHIYELGDLRTGDEVHLAKGITLSRSVGLGIAVASLQYVSIGGDLRGCTVTMNDPETDLVKIDRIRDWSLVSDARDMGSGKVRFALGSRLTNRVLSVQCDASSDFEELRKLGLDIPADQIRHLKVEHLSVPEAESVERPADATIAI